jgi:hypothetical protein
MGTRLILLLLLLLAVVPPMLVGTARAFSAQHQPLFPAPPNHLDRHFAPIHLPLSTRLRSKHFGTCLSEQLYGEVTECGDAICDSSRRSILQRIVLVAATTASGFVTTVSAEGTVDNSDDDDDNLTTRLFNADGSLKDSTMDTQARSRTVSFVWDAVDGTATTPPRRAAMDGISSPDSSNSGPTGSTSVRISYELPQKWNDQYVDNSSSNTAGSPPARCCEQIAVYQAPLASPSQLTKATRIGIAKALNLPDSVQAALAKADLISGRTVSVARSGGGERTDDNNVAGTYYEFDLAVAPSTCSGADADDLRLGFCPYDRVYLLSATTDANNKNVYVCCIQANRLQWKRANAELRRIRGSFRVTMA